LDLDHFKQLNDTHGHQVGDEILREFSLLINGLIRQGDFFARWGGEEFVLLCQSGYIHSMNTLAEKLRQHVEESRFILGKQANVTVSIGIAIAKSGETFEDLFNRADRALYQAKKTRNTVAYNG
jgi:diguanylate cyclase (GGDEF)-like protein